SQKRTQDVRKCDVDLLVDLDLADTWEVVLNWIFGCQDVERTVIERCKCRVKRGGLAASRWTRAKNHAIRSINGFFKRLELFSIKPELRHIDLQTGSIQDAHDDALAVNSGNGRNTIIDGAFLSNLHFDTPVLRPAPFRNIHPGQDLDSRNQRAGNRYRKTHDFVHCAIQTETDLQLVFPRFNMDVACPRVDGLAHDGIDQFDDRCILEVDLIHGGDLLCFADHLHIANDSGDQCFDFADIKMEGIVGGFFPAYTRDWIVFVLLLGEIAIRKITTLGWFFFPFDLLEPLFFPDAVSLAPGFPQRVIGRENGFDFVSGDKREIIQGGHVGWIQKRDFQPGPLFSNWTNHVLLGKMQRNQLDDIFGEIDGIHFSNVELFAQT